MVSPILSILAKDKLTWENYVKWKSNMNAILVSEDLDFVLTEECPPKPTKDADQIVWEAYKKWVKVDKRACWCILAGMSEVLVARHELMATLSLMMKSLHDIFEQPSEW